MNFQLILFLAFFVFSKAQQFCGQQNVAANFGTGSDVPQRAFNQSTIWLVWNKPDNHSSILDYNVYMTQLPNWGYWPPIKWRQPGVEAMDIRMDADLTLRNPSKDTVSIFNSSNAMVANVRFETFNANNGDGLGISRSKNLLAFNNFFNTGDDCIATNSGQGLAGQQAQGTAQHLWIFNNYFRRGHGAFVVGSMTAAWMEDILVEDNVLFLTDNGLRLKGTPATGGGARRIVFRDSAMLGVGVMQGTVTLGGREFRINQTDLGGQYTQSPFIFTLAYTAGNSAFAAANQNAQFRDINVTRVSVDNGKAGQGGCFMAVDGYDGGDGALGLPETFHRNLTFSNVKFTNVAPANISRLADSAFVDVAISNWGNSSSPWVIGNSRNLTFSNVHPEPDGF